MKTDALKNWNEEGLNRGAVAAWIRAIAPSLFYSAIC